MNWFLVLLFWNPAIQEYAVADGWHPIPYETSSKCEERLDFVNRYLPSKQDGTAVVDCIQAHNVYDAIYIAKGMVGS